MSFSTALDTNAIIDRLEETLLASPLLFPNTNGGSNTPDLVKQIIKYEFPLPEQPPGGLGPPHIWINVAPTPIVNRDIAGRGTRDIIAREILTYEFWCVCITQDSDPLRAQKQLYTIVSAVETAIGKNVRLTIPADQTDPLAFGISYYSIPFVLRTETNEQAAMNVVVRVQLFIDMIT